MYNHFVRFISLVGFASLAYQANQQTNQTQANIYGGLAQIFQLFYKISLRKEL